jgi:tetratricopeptide (TPR) repeat protein
MKFAAPHIFRFTTVIIFIFTLPSCSKEAKTERSLDAAMKHFEKGDYAAAEIELKNAMNTDPANPAALKQLGIIRETQGATFEAVQILMHVKDKLPKDDQVRVLLAKSFLRFGFVADCRKELFEVLDRSPSNGEALLLLAESSVTPEAMAEFDARLKKSGKKTSSTRLASALVDLRRGSMEEGSAVIEEVLMTEPMSARAHALKASILNSKKLPKDAVAEMKIAAEASGPRSNESILYAQMLMSNDQRDEAVAGLEKITVATPDFLPAWAMLGKIAYSEKKDEEATKYFTTALAKNPMDLATTLMQADVFVRGKQVEKAVQLLEKISTALPTDPQLNFALAKSYLSSDKLVKAAAALDRVLAVAPDLAEPARIRAQIHLQEGNATDAIFLLEKIRKATPDDSASNEVLVLAYRKAGRNEDAIALLRENADNEEKSPTSRVALGQILGSQGKFDEARLTFEGAVETFPNSLEAVSNLAALDLRQGKNDAALKRIQGFIDTHPDSADAYTLKAMVALGMKMSDVAEQSLNKSIELKADNAQAYSLLLQMKNGPGQEAEALAIIENFLKVFPNDSMALLQRGTLLEQLGRKEDAREAYTALIAAKPEYAPAYNNLATLEVEAFNNLESAAIHARKARALDKTQPAIADTLGWIEWQLGNYQAALPLLIEAAEKITNNPEVFYHLGMGYYSMGQAPEATANLTKSIAFGTNFLGKANAQKSLGLLSAAEKTTVADIESLQKKVAENPKDVISHLRLAELLANNGKLEEALSAYQGIYATNPAIVAALVGQARLYGGPLKSPEKALQIATQAREISPSDTKVLATLGLAKLEMGGYDEAYGLLKDASAKLENDSAILYDYARAAYSLGRIQEARIAMARVAACDQAIAEDAKLFLLMNDADAATQAGIDATVSQVLNKNPKNVSALMLRGLLETSAGKNPEATYLEVLKLHPRFDPARVKLAAIYLTDSAKIDEALVLARTARSSMPDDSELTRVLAVANYRKNDFKYAAQLFMELANKRPLVANELLMLGVSQFNSKQPENAKQTLDQAVAAGLAGEELAQAKEMIEKLVVPAEKK